MSSPPVGGSVAGVGRNAKQSFSDYWRRQKTDRKKKPQKRETTTKKTASIQCLRANPDSNREDFELKRAKENFVLKTGNNEFCIENGL